jgi:predicted kinase
LFIKVRILPKCYQLIGVSGSGKTTWVSNQYWIEDCVLVSTDMFVEKFARRLGCTYSEVFTIAMPRAIRLMMKRVRRAEKEGKDIVWDQTSTTMLSRKRKFNSLPTYDHIAVIFKTPNPSELARRLYNRPGKHIPKKVINSMIRNWEDPLLAEGFKEIWRT